MGGGICLSDSNSWMTTGFIYERFLKDVISRYPDDSELIKIIKVALTHNGLHLDHIGDQCLKRRILSAIELVAEQTLGAKEQNEVGGHRLDPLSEAMYLKSIARLLKWVRENK